MARVWIIVSLSYFQDVIEEAAASTVSNDYWRYLRHRVDGFEKQWLQKSLPNDDRRLTP